MQKVTPIVIAIVLTILMLSSFVFTVYQTDRALIIRLGKFVKDNKGEVEILAPGLHMKMPFIDKVMVFDARLNMAEIPSERIITKEKKDLLVDLFVEWQIENFPLFYNKTRTVSADVFLRQNVVDVLRSEFGQRTISNIVSGNRQELLEQLRKGTAENAASAGMKLVDIRIKRIDYPAEVNNAVFDRMRSDRKRDATELRARGSSEAETIRADADNKARVILAKARKEAQQIRGQGDAEAAQTYAEVSNKSPDFFEFYRSLEAYRKLFQENQDFMVLKPNSQFFKFFEQSGKE